MRGLAALSWVEMKLFLREPVGAFFTLAFPVLLLLLFGTIFGNAPVPENDGFGFVDTAVPAYTALVIATAAMLSLSTTIASYRERGVLRRLKATPLQPVAILAAHVIVLVAVTSMGMALLVAVGGSVFTLRCAGSVASLCAAFLLCSGALFAVGFVLASVVPTARSAQAIGMAIFYPMIFLSGAALPRALLPMALRRAAVVLPLTHVVTLLQRLWVGESWRAQLGEAGILIAFAGAGVALSVATFRWE